MPAGRMANVASRKPKATAGAHEGHSACNPPGYARKIGGPSGQIAEARAFLSSEKCIQRPLPEVAVHQRDRFLRDARQSQGKLRCQFRAAVLVVACGNGNHSHFGAQSRNQTGRYLQSVFAERNLVRPDDRLFRIRRRFGLCG